MRAPRHAAAHLNLGVGLEAAGDADGALKCYEAVLAIDPGNAYASYNIGKLYFLRQRVSAGRAPSPRSAGAQARISGGIRGAVQNLHDARGEYERRRRRWRSRFGRGPTMPAPGTTMRRRSSSSTGWGKRRMPPGRAIRFDPGFLPAYGFLGDLLRTDARLEEAVEMFRRARTLAGGGLACEQAELHALNYFDGISDQALFEKAPASRHADRSRVSGSFRAVHERRRTRKGACGSAMCRGISFDIPWRGS